MLRRSGFRNLESGFRNLESGFRDFVASWVLLGISDCQEKLDLNTPSKTASKQPFQSTILSFFGQMRPIAHLGTNPRSLAFSRSPAPNRGSQLKILEAWPQNLEPQPQILEA